MIHNYKIEYSNVELRQIEEYDLEKLRVWRNNSENTRFLRRLPYITKEMQKKWYENYLNNEDEMAFSIVETNELNRMVGSLSLYNFTDREVEFGKILIGDFEAHGRQLGTNALKAVVDFVFEQLNLDRVYLHVFLENTGAIHTYEKAGLKIVSELNTNEGLEYVMDIRKCLEN